MILADTNRPRRQGEVDGVHFWFVTKQEFQKDVEARKFIEWGEYQKHYYGTSVDAIRNVMEKGRTCVLTLRAQSLKTLRHPANALMPYVVFIAPPSVEKLRQQRAQLRIQAKVRTDRGPIAVLLFLLHLRYDCICE